MTLQLAGDIHLRSVAAFVLLDDVGQHQLRHGPGVLFHAAAQEGNPLLRFA
ncbi:hypothetical protein D3C75_1254740 [compost metagenome]